MVECLQTLHGLVSLGSHSDNLAVIFDDGEAVTIAMTYGEMLDAAGCIKDRLSGAGCTASHMVGLYYGQCVTALPCILGILETGASFAPIDPRAPHDLNGYFISSLHLRWVLLPDSLHEAFLDTYGSTLQVQTSPDVIVVKGIRVRLAKLWANEEHHPSSHDHLAYAMHTSGTTGRPKIVYVPHQCIVPNIVDLSAIFRIGPGDVVFMASPLTFDPSIVEMFSALSCGATVLVVPDAIKVMPRLLLHVLRRNQVSILQATPTLVYRFGITTLRQTLLASTTALRVLAFGGETCPTRAQILRIRAPDNATTTFYNLYGVTEVSSWATCCRIDVPGNADQSDESIPLGPPLLDTELEVRNGDGLTIQEGEGQLFVGGAARKCLLDGETWTVPLGKRVMRQTGDWVRFTERGLVLIGRHDDQIKRNGKRLCLSQVKQMIESLPLVESCEVTLATPGGKLLLFYVPSDPAVDESSVMRCLKATLPSHAIPDDAYCLGTLPVTLHGKVDRKALLGYARAVDGRRTGSGREGRGGWATGHQRDKLAHLWMQALSSPTSPEEDTLFIVGGGGDSFKAVQLAEVVQSLSAHAMPDLLQVILHEPFASVVAHIERTTSEGNNRNITTQSGPRLGSSPPSSELCRIVDFQTSVKTEGIEGTEVKRRKRSEHFEGTLTESLMNTSRTSLLAGSQDYSRTETDHRLCGEDRQCRNDRGNGEIIDSLHDCRNPSGQMDKNPPRSSSHGPPCQYSVRRCSQLAWTRLQNRAEDLKKTEDGPGAGDDSPSHGSEGDILIVDDDDDEISLPSKLNFKGRWKFDTGKCVDASPLVVQRSRSESVVYIGSHSHKFAAISLATGEALWVVELGDRVESSACLSSCGKKVVVGCYDNCVYTIDAFSGTILWKYETRGPIKSSPVSDNTSDIVYIGSHDQCLYALNIEDRDCRWRLNGGGGSFFSSPVVNYRTNCVYAATLTGNLLAVDKETGRIMWTFNCGKPVFSSPVAAKDSILIGCVDGNLYAVSYKGRELWQFPTDAPVFSSPCVQPWHPSQHTRAGKHPSVVFGSHDGHVYCLCLATGRQRWKHRMPSAVYASPFVFRSRGVQRERAARTVPRTVGLHTVTSRPNPDHATAMSNTSEPIGSEPPDVFVVVVCSTDGSVATLDLVSAEVIASCQLPGEVFSSPVVHGDCLVVGCRDDFVYCLDANQLF